MINITKLKKLQKVQKLRPLYRSCQEVMSEVPRRAREGKGPEAGRKRACDFADGFSASFHRQRSQSDLELRLGQITLLCQQVWSKVLVVKYQ